MCNHFLPCVSRPLSQNSPIPPCSFHIPPVSSFFLGSFRPCLDPYPWPVVLWSCGVSFPGRPLHTEMVDRFAVAGSSGTQHCNATSAKPNLHIWIYLAYLRHVLHMWHLGFLWYTILYDLIRSSLAMIFHDMWFGPWSLTCDLIWLSSKVMDTGCDGRFRLTEENPKGSERYSCAGAVTMAHSGTGQKTERLKDAHDGLSLATCSGGIKDHMNHTRFLTQHGTVLPFCTHKPSWWHDDPLWQMLIRCFPGVPLPQTELSTAWPFNWPEEARKRTRNSELLGIWTNFCIWGI